MCSQVAFFVVMLATTFFRSPLSSSFIERCRCGFVYFCAERASLKSAADRVPGLTKELTETKKRLSQLEAMTNPSPSGGVTKMPSGKSYLDLSPEEQFNQLKQDASVLY
jgi:hypothetical protein